MEKVVKSYSRSLAYMGRKCKLLGLVLFQYLLKYVDYIIQR